MHSHSLDLRQRIVQSYLAGEGSIRKIAKRFLVNPTNVYQTWFGIGICLFFV